MFRVVTSRTPRSPRLPGSSLPPELQWGYRQWLQQAEDAKAEAAAQPAVVEDEKNTTKKKK